MAPAEKGRLAGAVSQADARHEPGVRAHQARRRQAGAPARAGGIKCAALHADRTQSERSAAVEGFKSGRYRALVATDIAARGIDIDDIGHVVNYEVPHSVDAYVHRVGRTGRAESTGTAVTLAGPDELAGLRVIEKALNVTFEIARAGAGGSEDTRRAGMAPTRIEEDSCVDMRQGIALCRRSTARARLST